MEKIDKNTTNVINFIKQELDENPELIIKELNINKNKVYILYIESVTDRTTINNFLLEYLSFDIKKNDKDIKNLYEYLNSHIPANKIVKLEYIDDLIYNLMSGFSVILIENEEKALSIETKAALDSGITIAQNERTIRGPKDAFTENYQLNVGLIRKRIKTPKLRLKEFIIGEYGQAKVGVIYIDGIAIKEKVDIITRRIKKIRIDTALGVTQIVEMISGNEKNVFPNYLLTERPDYTTINLLNGRIVILLENTPYVAILPAVFDDFIQNAQDYYSRTINTTITRFIRLTAFLLTLLTPAFYVAITTYNHETIPSKLLINFAIQRDGVPFATIVEAILMILTFEILKETDARIPSAIGSSLSIVGALVLGEAAVSAGIVSPIMVIVIAITSISSLIINYADFSDGTRVWRIAFIVGASIAGTVGIVVVGFLFITFITTIKSMGVPFLSNHAPFIKWDFGNSIIFKFKNKYFRRSAVGTRNRRIR